MKNVLLGYFVMDQHMPIDEFVYDFDVAFRYAKKRIFHDDPMETLNFLDFCLEHEQFDENLKQAIADEMEQSCLAYRWIKGEGIVPLTGDEHATAMRFAFDCAQNNEFHGVQHHLSKAADALSTREWADSIRENMQAVESVVRQVTGEKEYSKALVKLDQLRTMHPALKAGFKSLYGYTSDEGGLRHPLIDEQKGEIDESLALMMSHLCIGFINFVMGFDLQRKLDDEDSG